MKIAVIGGGSTYTPELVAGFLARAGVFPLSELWLVDTDPYRLEIVGGFARRMAAVRGGPFQVHLATERREALAGAAYVITQLRVGGMAARRADEYLGRRHGLIGQETTGVGGMAKALRTIPVILQIAAELGELSPGAWLVNFTNPAGLVTEALQQELPGVRSVGVCNMAINMKMRILQALEPELGMPLAADRAALDTLGLNHLTWHRGFTLDGEDLWPHYLAHTLARLRASPEPEWDPFAIESLGMIPNDYLQYYDYTGRKLAAQASWPPSRAEQVMEVEQVLLQQYADPALDEPPPDLMKRGGAYYSTVATQLLNALWNDLGEIHVVNTRHASAVPGWPADWVLELPCRVDRAGIHPLPAAPLPDAPARLLAQVKQYEKLTVRAAVHGDREAAAQALLAHPLGPTPEQVSTVLADLLETHRAYLPQFWRGPG